MLALLKMPDWLSFVSAIRLLVPGTVHPDRTPSRNGYGQITTLYLMSLYISLLCVGDDGRDNQTTLGGLKHGAII